MTPSRRGFLTTGAAGAACAVLAPPVLARSAPLRVRGDAFPTTEPERSREIVGASHARLERVEELLAEDAGLAKAAWDWGFGDWETAIGAASHTGRTDIIEVLIAHGARPDLFTLAALDRVDAVRAIVESLPAVRALEGPHSIPLYDHARFGKAERVLEYFESVGIGPTNVFAIEKAQTAAYLGEYAWGAGDQRFVVSWNERRESLDIARAGQITRGMIPLGDHAFSPAGARHAVIRFELADGRATALTLRGVNEPLRAARAVG